MNKSTTKWLLIAAGAGVAYYLYTQSQAANAAAQNAALATNSGGGSTGGVVSDIQSVLQDFGVSTG